MMFQIHPPWLGPTSQELAKSRTNQRRQFEPKGYRPLDGFCHLQCGVGYWGVLPRVLGGGLVVNLSVNPPTQLLPPRQTTIMIQITVVLMYHILCGEQPAQQNRYSVGWPGIPGNILMSAKSNFGPVDDNFRFRWQTSLSCLGGQSKNIRCVIRYPHPTARNYLRIKNNTTISWSIDHGLCDDVWNDDELG